MPILRFGSGLLYGIKKKINKRAAAFTVQHKALKHMARNEHADINKEF